MRKRNCAEGNFEKIPARLFGLPCKGYGIKTGVFRRRNLLSRYHITSIWLRALCAAVPAVSGSVRKTVNPPYDDWSQGGFFHFVLARQRPRLPCVKATEGSALAELSAKLTEGLLEQFLSQNSSSRLKRAFHRSSLSRDQFVSRRQISEQSLRHGLRRATSLYTREALVLHKIADRTVHRKVYRSALLVSIRQTEI